MLCNLPSYILSCLLQVIQCTETHENMAEADKLKLDLIAVANDLF